MINNQIQSPPQQSNAFPTPSLQDRSLKTVDIKGAQPQKPYHRQDIFENRSLITNDIKGAQPKATIRSLDYSHFNSSSSARSPDFAASARSPIGAASISIQSPTQAMPLATPTANSQYQQYPNMRSTNSSSNNGNTQHYHPISAHDPQKNSYYNGPVQDRIFKPHNQPPSQIKADSILVSAPYHHGILRPSNGQSPMQSPEPFSSTKKVYTGTGTGYLGNTNDTAHSRSAAGEIFSHSAVLRPNHFDSVDTYNQLKQSMREKIVKPKDIDLPDKMVKYQTNKDNIFKFQEPKLQLNRQKLNLEQQQQQPQLSSSYANHFSSSQLPRGQSSSALLAGHTKSEQHAQQPNTARLPSNPVQATVLNRASSSQQLQLASSVLSPRHSAIERNLLSNRQNMSSSNAQDKVAYFKPYHLNPKIDISTEYTDRYAMTSIDQLKKSITTPAQRNEAASAAQVPWQQKQFAYNIIGNYVRDKRPTDQWQSQATPAVDSYFSGYNADAIASMRKDIQERGKYVPYEVKFKHHKSAIDSMHHPLTMSTSATGLASPMQLNGGLSSPIGVGTSTSSAHNFKKFKIGQSDLFRASMNTAIRDPVNPNKFFYAEKQVFHP